MSNRGLLKTLLRGLAILDYIAQHPDGASNTQVAKEFNIDPAVSYRLLQTLTHAGYVHKEKKEYRLSCHLFTLVMVSRSVLIDLATPLVQALAEKTEFTASLSVLEGHNAYPILLRQGKAPLVVNANLGKPVPLYASSLGKVLLAYLPSEQRNQIMRSTQLLKLTPNTIVDKKELQQELAQIRSRGFAIDGEEYLPGVRCIAAPVLDQTGRVICALSVSYPATYALSNDKFDVELSESIRRVAEELSHIVTPSPSTRSIETRESREGH